MINDLNDWVALPPTWAGFELVWGGSDIEPNWSSWAEAYDWAAGYTFIFNGWPAEGKWRYVDWGSADGCPPAGSNCDNGWDQGKIRSVAYGLEPAWPMPDIYSRDGVMAAQWQQISANAGWMQFLGSVTEDDACRNVGCAFGLDNPPSHGWRQLWTLANADAATGGAINWSTDLSWTN